MSDLRIGKRTAFLLVLLPIVIGLATARADIQLFPPSNMAQCNADTALMFDGSHPVSCNAPVPAGAVMMFNLSACPSGWSEMPGLAGRVIVGSGPYTETSPGSNPTGFSANYNVGDDGGSAFRSLTMDQMPKHSHKIRITDGPDDHDLAGIWAFDYDQQGYVEWDWTNFAAGGNNSGTNPNPAPDEMPATDPYNHSLLAADGDGKGPFTSNDWAGGTTSLTEGQANPVDTRMPYYTLRFCQKN